jgi:hypothetical protein
LASLTDRPTSVRSVALGAHRHLSRALELHVAGVVDLTDLGDDALFEHIAGERAEAAVAGAAPLARGAAP